jgi:hypothetical protein
MLRRLAALAMLAAVTGCATAPPVIVETTAAVPDQEPVTNRAAHAAAPIPSVPTPPMAAPLPPVDTNPRQFIGLTSGELVGRLGIPTFRRVDRPAMVWQYRGGSCVVDVFLFREHGQDRVYEVIVRRAQGIQHVRDDNCLAALLRDRNQPRIS